MCSQVSDGITTNELTKTMKSTVANEKGIIDTLHIINQDLSENTKPLLQGHWVDGGIRGLIAEILAENDACFPKGAENTEVKAIVIACSMTVEQVWEKCLDKFTSGTTRYPFSTVATYLAHYMLKDNQVVKITLDDETAKAIGKSKKAKVKTKDRAKYYLVVE